MSSPTFIFYVYFSITFYIFTHYFLCFYAQNFLALNIFLFYLFFVIINYYTQDEAINVVIDSFFNILLFRVLYQVNSSFYYYIFICDHNFLYCITYAIYTRLTRDTNTAVYFWILCFSSLLKVSDTHSLENFWVFHNFHLHNYYKFAFRSYTCLLKMLQLHLNYFEWF